MSSEILIVVLNYNGWYLTQECLDSIEENTLYENREVLVVDNGSEQFDAELIEDKGHQVMLNDRNLGFDIAMNNAIYENPDYDYYLLLNNDTEVKEGWLKKLLKTSKEKEAGLVAPKLEYPDGETQSAGVKLPEIESVGYEKLQNKGKHVYEVDGFLGAAFMVSSEVIDQIGYLDEVFTPGNREEWDYCMRGKKEGIKAFINSNSVVKHKEEKTKEKIQSEIVYLMQRKNKMKFEIMNRSKKDILNEALSSAKYMVAGLLGKGYNPVRVQIKAYSEVLLDLPHLLNRRYRTTHVPSYYSEDIKDYSRRYENF